MRKKAIMRKKVIMKSWMRKKVNIKRKKFLRRIRRGGKYKKKKLSPKPKKMKKKKKPQQIEPQPQELSRGEYAKKNEVVVATQLIIVVISYQVSSAALTRSQRSFVGLMGLGGNWLAGWVLVGFWG